LIARIVGVGRTRAVIIGKRTLKKIVVTVRAGRRADRFWSSTSSFSKTWFLSRRAIL
jgi:hypothetical protein